MNNLKKCLLVLLSLLFLYGCESEEKKIEKMSFVQRYNLYVEKNDNVNADQTILDWELSILNGGNISVDGKEFKEYKLFDSNNLSVYLKNIKDNSKGSNCLYLLENYQNLLGHEYCYDEIVMLQEYYQQTGLKDEYKKIQAVYDETLLTKQLSILKAEDTDYQGYFDDKKFFLEESFDKYMLPLMNRVGVISSNTNKEVLHYVIESAFKLAKRNLTEHECIELAAIAIYKCDDDLYNEIVEYFSNYVTIYQITDELCSERKWIDESLNDHATSSYYPFIYGTNNNYIHELDIKDDKFNEGYLYIVNRDTCEVIEVTNNPIDYLEFTSYYYEDYSEAFYPWIFFMKDGGLFMSDNYGQHIFLMAEIGEINPHSFSVLHASIFNNAQDIYVAYGLDNKVVVYDIETNEKYEYEFNTKIGYTSIYMYNENLTDGSSDFECIKVNVYNEKGVAIGALILDEGELIYTDYIH